MFYAPAISSSNSVYLWTAEHIILRFYYYLFQSQSTKLPVPSFWSLVQLLLFIFIISHELEKKH